MNWYNIEYSGGKSSRNVIGQSALNLDQVLNSPDAPKFIKIENISYYSKLSKKHELYENWDSKWENEIWINTSSIISIRKIKDDLLVNPSEGEWNAFSNKIPFGLLVSTEYVNSDRATFEGELIPSLNELISQKRKRFGFANKIEIQEQRLLKKDEFIFTHFGRQIIRRENCKDIRSEILIELEKYLKEHIIKNED